MTRRSRATAALRTRMAGMHGLHTRQPRRQLPLRPAQVCAFAACVHCALHRSRLLACNLFASSVLFCPSSSSAVAARRENRVKYSEEADLSVNFARYQEACATHGSNSAKALGKLSKVTSALGSILDQAQLAHHTLHVEKFSSLLAEVDAAVANGTAAGLRLLLE